MTTLIHCAEILRQPGAVRDLDAKFELAGFELPLADLAGPVRLDAALEGVLEGLVVAGTVEANVRLRCARCLHEEVRTLSSPVNELFSSDPELADDGDVYPAGAETIDVEQMLVDTVGLAVPEVPVLCDGPPGDCPRYRELLAAGRIEAETDRIDPRWAALSGLLDETKEED